MKISAWSRFWNWLYWVRHRKIKENVENYLKNCTHCYIDSICNWMKGFEYRGDWPLIHWTQLPITTVHRKKGDCEDLARLWYDQLKRLGYNPYVYKLYKRKWYTLGIPVWWHTVVNMYEYISCHEHTFWIFSNTVARKIGILGYMKENNYCDFKRWK